MKLPIWGPSMLTPRRTVMPGHTPLAPAPHNAQLHLGAMAICHSPGVNIPNQKDRHLLPKPGGLPGTPWQARLTQPLGLLPAYYSPGLTPARTVSCCVKRVHLAHHSTCPGEEARTTATTMATQWGAFLSGNMRARSWPPQPQVPKNFLCTAHSLQTGQCSEQLLHHEERIPGCGQNGGWPGTSESLIRDRQALPIENPSREFASFEDGVSKGVQG